MRGAHVVGGSVKGSWSTLAGWAVHAIGRGLLHESDPHDLEARHNQAQQLKMLLGERRGKAVPMRIHQAVGLVVPIAAALRGLSRLERGLTVGDVDALSRQVLSLRNRWRQLDPIASRTRLRRVTRLAQRASEHVGTEAAAGRVPLHVAAWMQRAISNGSPRQRSTQCRQAGSSHGLVTRRTEHKNKMMDGARRTEHKKKMMNGGANTSTQNAARTTRSASCDLVPVIASPFALAISWSCLAVCSAASVVTDLSTAISCAALATARSSFKSDAASMSSTSNILSSALATSGTQLPSSGETASGPACPSAASRAGNCPALPSSAGAGGLAAGGIGGCTSTQRLSVPSIARASGSRAHVSSSRVGMTAPGPADRCAPSDTDSGCASSHFASGGCGSASSGSASACAGGSGTARVATTGWGGMRECGMSM